ncbi:hypothetical protein ACPCK9_26810 [Streptomyces koyangensis]|uniref:hypothetical protein n=1 Tax=Streptomyces koyangensis TaxID=188770 RepID=UPI003C2D211F
MAFKMSTFVPNRWTKVHPHRVYTVGSTEPVLTILDVRGFDIADLLLIGLNDSCGTLMMPLESRAEAAAALEPGYECEVRPPESHDGLWAVDFTRRALDGTTLSPFLTDLTLKDGRQVIKDGRWTS